jgi:hypothetical protein
LAAAADSRRALQASSGFRDGDCRAGVGGAIELTDRALCDCRRCAAQQQRPCDTHDSDTSRSESSTRCGSQNEILNSHFDVLLRRGMFGLELFAG